jgi:L,D-transpeptidase ErfK/SrfK
MVMKVDSLLKLISLHIIFILLVILSNNTITTQIITSKGNSLTVCNDTVIIKSNITIANYFQYLDSIVNHYDSLTPYQLTEHILVRANPWIIDTLALTDYYVMMAKDSFVYNQKNMIALKAGSKLCVPDSLTASILMNSFKNTYIDINIPEFKLRIYDSTTLKLECLVRVGRNEKKFLKMANRLVDLKTKTGNGSVVRFEKYPDYYNPVTGHKYLVTKRDDQKVTQLPQIPFIETEINGIRNGQLIHPTTNLNTLGKAYSNGCIGTSEADAWKIYYYAPIGTKIKIRYDLEINKQSDSLYTLKDIYNYKATNHK